MPKGQVDTTSTRFNPYITKSINKSLLTPCRQIGLSRKRKTPTNSNNSFSETNYAISNNSSILETTPVGLTLTPSELKNASQEVKVKKKSRVSKRLISDDDTEVTPLKESKSSFNNSEETCTVLTEPIMTEVGSECQGTIDLTSSQNLNNVEGNGRDTLSNSNSKEGAVMVKKETKSKIGPKSSKKERKLLYSKPMINDSDDDETLQNMKLHLKKKGNDQVSLKDTDEMTKTVTETTVNENVGIGSKKKGGTLDCQDMEDFSVRRYKKHKTYKGRSKEEPEQLNTPKDVIQHKAKSDEKKVEIPLIDLTNKEVDSKTKTCKSPKFKSSVNIYKAKSDEKEAKALETPLVDLTNKEVDSKTCKSPKFKSSVNILPSPTQANKMKRSLSMKKSSEEEYRKDRNDILKECTITLKPLEANLNISELEVKKLKNQIKEKRKLLDDLRQAEIYKKKHDVTELKELTARWKRGCISALNDLLPQLQAHATMDMAMLLKNLRVPEELVTLSQTEDLV